MKRAFLFIPIRKTLCKQAATQVSIYFSTFLRMPIALDRTAFYFYCRRKSKPFEMKNRIVQLTHRYPVLEYVYNIAFFFITSLLLVVLLVVIFGLIAGT
jgi:hypothetical protein